MFAALMVLLAAPATGPAAEATVVKSIKEAERAGFERHHLARYLRLFTEDATWTSGRREAPDVHDVVLDRATKVALLSLEYAAAPSNRARVFFESPEVVLEGDAPRVVMTQRRTFFGGQDASRRRYDLTWRDGRWQVAGIRSWPLGEVIGLSKVKYEPAFWVEADAVVDEPGTLDLSERFEALVAARRYLEAFTLARRAAEAREATVTDLLRVAEVALRIGNIKAARAAAARARQLDPGADVPPLLAHDPKR